MEAQPVYLLFLLATCATLAFSQGATMHYVEKLGGSLTMYCTEQVIPDTVLSHWVLNDLTVLYKNQENEAFKSQAGQLTILKVEESSFGDYFCMLNKQESNGNVTALYFKNTVDKKLESLWDQFRTQTIVGVVAAVVTLVVVIGLCFVWRYRWKPEKQDIMAVNGGYDTADGYQSPGKAPGKTYYPPEPEVGFINESFAKSAPPERKSIIVDDTRF